MSHFKLYFFPGTCARISMIALEELQQPFDAELVVLMRGEHKAPAYLQLNPKGKVPTLLIDGQPLTETLAIVNYLHQRFPTCGLLPSSTEALTAARIQSDLAWCNSTMQPLITGVLFPQFFSGAAPATAATGLVRQQFSNLITPHLQLLEQRVSQQHYVQGNSWSLLDAYVFWIWDQLMFGGFDGAAFPSIAAHAERSKARPSVQRALAREAAAFAQMAAQGIHLGPPPSK